MTHDDMQDALTLPVLLDRVVEWVIVAAVVVFGSWQILCVASTFSGLTFNQLKLLLPFYAIGLVAALYLLGRFREKSPTAVATPEPENLDEAPWVAKLLAGVAMLAIYWATEEFVLFGCSTWGY